MEKIDKNNYEAYFLDYAEGNLTEPQLLLLNEFLKKHPALKSELEEFEIILLEEKNTSSNFSKEQLFREESTGLTTADYLMISEVEGTINKTEKLALASLVEKDKSLLHDLSVYHTTKLPVNKKVIYPAKEELFQKETKIIFWWRSIASVAAAILALVIFNLNNEPKVYFPSQPSFSADNSTSDEVQDYAFTIKEQPSKEGTALLIDNKTNTIKSKSTIEKQSNTSLAKINSPASTELNSDELEKIQKQPFETEVVETSNPKLTPIVQEDQPETLAEVSPTKTKNEEFVTLKDFAKQKVLKGKTFSETVADELAELAKEKLDIKVERSKKEDKFAVNIGKFSFSRNK